MSTVVVAEKPSVARDLARVLGARTRGEGCLSGNGYVVTWALGHLVHLAEPDDYGPPWNGRWSLAHLPMIPSEWRLRTERKTAAQLRVVEGLLNAPDTGEIVVATDAGREGELIFRLIHQHARCRRPFQRLWISSLTDQAIAEGFRRLQPGAVFDDLAAAARARAQADWLVGMNLTRAYTVRQGVLCTLGRVQTPTLAMLVAREREITAFQVTTYYELVAHLVEGFDARYRRDGKTRIDSRAEAEKLHRRLSPESHAVVESVDQEIRRHRPPPFHSLVDLQREANRRYGFTAAQTLQHAQSLYESLKLITYPRTESRHLPEDMEPRLPRILESLPHPQAAVALERLHAGHRLGRSHVDQTRLTDHHAIVPTGTKPPETLAPPLQRIFDLVASRFVAAFLPDQVVEETSVVLRIGTEEFYARGERVLDEGWTVAEAPRVDRPARRPRQRAAEPEAVEEPDKGSDEQGQALPPLTVGQRLGVAGMEVVEKETQPPRRYTDATLLTAMKNAGRQLEDEALAEAMKQTGLGTSATRAEIIERLIRSELVERQRKALAPTEKGMALISVAAEPLRSPELTASWEQRLKDVEEGRLEAGAFYDEIVRFVRELVPQVATGPVMDAALRSAARPSKRKGRQAGAAAGESPSTAGPLGPCPKCRQGQVIEGRKGYGCNRYREGCSFVVWKEIAGKRLAMTQVRELLEHGRTGPIAGFRSRAGRRFAASLKLDPEMKVVFDFEPRQDSAGARPKGRSRRGAVRARESEAAHPSSPERRPRGRVASRRTGSAVQSPPTDLRRPTTSGESCSAGRKATPTRFS